MSIRHRVKQGAFPAAPLRHTGDFGPEVKELPGTTTSKADRSTVRTRFSFALVSLHTIEANIAQGGQPPGTNPVGCLSDIGDPEWVSPWDPSVDPEMVTGMKQDGPSASAPTSHLDTRGSKSRFGQQSLTLGAAQHHCRMVHSSYDSMALGQLPERLDVSQCPPLHHVAGQSGCSS